MTWFATILTALGVIVAGAAAIFAWVQASTATGARKDAQEARDAAAEHERRALAALQGLEQASGRTASATEGIDASATRTAAALERIATVPPPWKLEELTADGDWRLINNSSTMAISKRVLPDTPDRGEWFDAPGWMANVEKSWNPGDWEHITHKGAGMLASPGPITILVVWRWWDDPDEVQDRTWKGIIS
jgi:hypothetical protein